ncbi:MAG: CehA/McbA family metallohydrolase, partial [Chloroflexota bacterium]
AQTSVRQSSGTYWVYALPNPHPEQRLRAVRLEASGTAAVAVAALTCFYGREHPLRHRQLQSFRVTLPEAQGQGTSGQGQGDGPADVETSIDLGVIARKYAVPAFNPDAWLAGQGVSQPLPQAVPAEPLRELFVDVTASADATLRVAGHDVPLRDAYERGEARSTDGALRVEILTPHKTWLHVAVQDAGGKAIPSRVHFRAPDGRYLPPYGYRHEVNDNWFEDYGNDLKLHGTQYAYVDGTFQAELPVGEVYAEVFKGFEYQPLRQRLTIQPGQRALTLNLERPLNWRRFGWVTADTHVHFISPQTAWLQGQAEGLNLINLLASQWGDLFTNVGDISGGLSGVSRDETLIWVGTENRQHLLGHMSLLGIKGEPVFPMTTSGPSESYLGDPTWTTMAEWADEARRKDGVVVIPHFPNPYCEVAADIVNGKIDAVEINMGDFAMQIGEWYRYLNCGFRVAAVGGTDKMSASMPVGAIRTYALLGDSTPFSFEAWGAAVRAGRTFTTTGPLVDISVEGHRPGDEMQLPSGGGTLHVEAHAESVVPFHALEVVVNGEVVASERKGEGAYACTLSAPIQVPGSAWIAARCTSQMNRWIGSPRAVAAHTSPVYVVAGGEELFSPSDATYMLTLLEGGLTWLDTLSIPADPERHARNRRVFEAARDHLHQRLHTHGQAHDHG